MGRSLLQATSTCSTGGCSTHGGAAAWRSAPCGTHGCRGTACSTRGLSTGRRGTSAACLEHLLPSCCTHLGGCRAGAHPSLPASVMQQGFPLHFSLSFPPKGPTNATQLSSGQRQVPLELDGAGSDLPWGSCWTLLTEDTPAACPNQNLAT